MRAYENMVYTTAARLLGETEAFDVAQEVFLRAYEHYDDLAGNPHAGGWLKTVARNLCLNHLTRYRARWTLFSEVSRDDDSDPVAGLADPACDAEGGLAAQAAERRAAVEEALSRLPEGQRVPLVLYHFEDMSYEEIAARLGVSLAKIKTDIHRARTALKRRLASAREELRV